MNRSELRNKLFIFFYLFVVTWLIFTITGQIYGVNDDVILQNWLSGQYTGKPELMIRGSATPRILFGVIVSNLYSLVPQINWFSIVLLGLTLISWYLIGLISIKTNNLLVLISYAIVTFLHLIWFIPSPTYTASAAILSFSTIVYVAFSIRNQSFSKLLYVLFLLYAFAYLVRPESFLLGTAAAGAFLFFALLVTMKEFKTTIRRTYVGLILCLVVIGSDYAYERFFYSQNKDWGTYKKWEIARYKIQANAPEKIVSSDPSKYGWTQAEVELFKSYNYIDPKNFTVIKFEKLIEESDAFHVNVNLRHVNKTHQKIFDSDVNWEWKRLISITSLFYVIFLLISLPRVRIYILLTTSGYGILYFIMFYIAGFLRQPERVQVSVIFLATLVSLISYIFTKKDKKLISSSPTILLGGLMLILVFSNAFAQSKYLANKIPKWSDSFWYNQTEYLSGFPADSVFVGNASQFRNNWLTPYLVSDIEVEDRILTFGWHNFSPHWIKRAQKLQLNPYNIFESVISDPRVYWVSDLLTMGYIVQYMKENGFEFNGPKKVGVMSHFGDEYVVWDFSRNE